MCPPRLAPLPQSVLPRHSGFEGTEPSSDHFFSLPASPLLTASVSPGILLRWDTQISTLGPLLHLHPGSSSMTLAQGHQPGQQLARNVPSLRRVSTHVSFLKQFLFYLFGCVLSHGSPAQ